MDAFIELVSRRVKKEVDKQSFIKILPCKVLAKNDNGKYLVELVTNKAKYNVLNCSGTDINVSEIVMLFYKGNIISDDSAFIGAAENKEISPSVEEYDAGKTIPTGTRVTISGQTYTVANNAEIFNDYTNNKAVNPFSHAEGTNTTAIGYAAHAEGLLTNANGAMAHTEGYQTNVAISATYAHAEGYGTNANANASHAEGQSTTTSGFSSHAEGQGSTASGGCSHAEGSSTTASGLYAHSEGSSTTASGSGAHSENGNTTASGDNSHAEGQGTVAKRTASHAEGWYTIAGGQYQHVSGKYNVEDTNNKYALIIGNGTGNNARSNAFAVDWNGLVYINNSQDGIDLSQISIKLHNVEADDYLGELFNDFRPIAIIYLTASQSNDCTLNFCGTVYGTSNGTAEFKIQVDDVDMGWSCKQTVPNTNFQLVSFSLPVTVTQGDHTIKIFGKGAGNIYPVNSFMCGGSIRDIGSESQSTRDYDIITDSDGDRMITFYKGDSETPAVPKRSTGIIKKLSATSFNYSDVENTYLPNGLEEIE